MQVFGILNLGHHREIIFMELLSLQKLGIYHICRFIVFLLLQVFHFY